MESISIDAALTFSNGPVELPVADFGRVVPCAVLGRFAMTV